MNKKQVLANFGETTQPYKILKLLFDRDTYVSYEDLILEMENNKFTKSIIQNKDIFHKKKKTLIGLIGYIKTNTGVEIANHRKKGYKVRVRSPI